MPKKSAGEALTVEYKPCMYVDLSKAKLDTLEKLKIGQKVSFRVTGTVKSLEYSERQYEKNKPETRGTVGIENFKVALTGGNEFSELAEDDE